MYTLIDILLKLLVGTCLYLHDPWLSAAYGFFIFNNIYHAVKIRQGNEALKATLTEAGYTELQKGVYGLQGSENGDDGNDPTWQ